jgi:hypothetical protein
MFYFIFAFIHNFQNNLGMAIITDHSFWLFTQSSKEFNLADLLKASIRKYKKLHIATSVAHSIAKAFGQHTSVASDILSVDHYHLTSEQLLKITLDNLIST